MTIHLRSRDVNSDMLTDKLTGADSQIYIHKHKIVFGSDGNYTDVTPSTPFPTTGGGGGGGNSSVGVNGDPIPGYSTLIGGEDENGDLQPTRVENGYLLVKSQGTFDIQELKPIFNEVSAVAIGFETLINTYTAPVGKIAYLLTILTSGGNRATYNIYNNGVLFDRQYTNVTVLAVTFDYKTGSSSVPGYVIPVGNTIDVKVLNNGTTVADYNARFLILEVVP